MHNRAVRSERETMEHPMMLPADLRAGAHFDSLNLGISVLQVPAEQAQPPLEFVFSGDSAVGLRGLQPTWLRV